MSYMHILPGIRIIDLALYFEKEKILALSDFHLGYEEALNKQGVLIPRFQFIETLERLEKIFTGLDIKQVIINGDLKYEFGMISQTEWRDTSKLLDFISERCKNIVLIKGNHDTILGPIADKKGIKLVDFYETNSAIFIHGHKLVRIKSGKTLVIGHEHPAIGLRSNLRIEHYKCFLKGKFSKQDLIVMPSFNLVTEGGNILKEKLLSPYLKNIGTFEVYVVGEKDKNNKNVFYFGKIGNLI